MRSAGVALAVLAEPLTAAALGLLVLGERPDAPAALGALGLLAGLTLMALRPGRSTPPTAARETGAHAEVTIPPSAWPERCIVVDQALPPGLAATLQRSSPSPSARATRSCPAKT